MFRWTCSCQCMVIVLVFSAINCLCTSSFLFFFLCISLFLASFAELHPLIYRSSPSFYSVYLCLLFLLRHKADKVIVSSKPNTIYLAISNSLTNTISVNCFHLCCFFYNRNKQYYRQSNS